MKRDELIGSLGTGLFGNGDDEVSIKLDQPSAGPCAMAGIECAFDGFDWEQGHLVLVPDTPLVSWDYLERVHPGIRELIEQERKAYSRRPLRVIVAGSRGFGDAEEERAVIRRHMECLACPPYVTPDRIEVVSGCARGADTAGAEIARELGYAVREFPADWDTHGKAAGMIRNREMADYASEDDRRWRGMLLAFWDGESRGTADMIRTAEKAGLSVRIVRTEPEEQETSR